MRGSASELAERYAAEAPRGEVVLVVGARGRRRARARACFGRAAATGRRGRGAPATRGGGGGRAHGHERERALSRADGLEVALPLARTQTQPPAPPQALPLARTKLGRWRCRSRRPNSALALALVRTKLGRRRCLSRGPSRLCAAAATNHARAASSALRAVPSADAARTPPRPRLARLRLCGRDGSRPATPCGRCDWLALAAARPVVGAFHVFPSAPFARGQRRGIDVAARAGAVVRAACPGRVSFTGALPRRGLAVAVRCGSLMATYLGLGHLTARTGSRVARGDALGVLGASGRLRLGARRASDRRGYVDPMRLLTDSVPPLRFPPPTPRLEPAAAIRSLPPARRRGRSLRRRRRRRALPPRPGASPGRPIRRSPWSPPRCPSAACCTAAAGGRMPLQRRRSPCATDSSPQRPAERSSCEQGTGQLPIPVRLRPPTRRGSRPDAL